MPTPRIIRMSAIAMAIAALVACGSDEGSKQGVFVDSEVAGPALAQSLTALGLIDEYRIYLHPVVLGQGKPYFAGPRPPLRLIAHDRIGEDAIRLSYVPA